jgi:hypothetical protein
MFKLRLTVIVVSLLGFRSAPSWAGAELLQLSADSLPREVPHWRELGVQPGDVLLRNELVSAVIFTAERADKSPTIGRCLLTPAAGAASGIVMHPGPVELWGKAEAATTAQIAAVRFRHQTERFVAELVYTVRDGQPWLEVSTTLRNLDRELILEIPMVDEVYVDGKVDRDGRHAWYVVPKGTGAVAIVPVQFALGAYDGPKGLWHVGVIADDPEPSFVKRASARIFHLNRPTSFTPVSVNRGWDRDLRDKEHWHRIAPGQERTATRRLVSAASLEDARTLVQFATESPRGGLQAVPTTSGLPVPERRITTRSSSTAKPAAANANPPAKPQATVSRRPANRPANERRPSSTPPGSAPSRPRELPNLDNGDPLPSLPARIKEIDRLPPPVDG